MEMSRAFSFLLVTLAFLSRAGAKGDPPVRVVLSHERWYGGVPVVGEAELRGGNLPCPGRIIEGNGGCSDSLVSGMLARDHVLFGVRLPRGTTVRPSGRNWGFWANPTAPLRIGTLEFASGANFSIFRGFAARSVVIVEGMLLRDTRVGGLPIRWGRVRLRARKGPREHSALTHFEAVQATLAEPAVVPGTRGTRFPAGTELFFWKHQGRRRVRARPPAELDVQGFRTTGEIEFHPGGSLASFTLVRAMSWRIGGDAFDVTGSIALTPRGMLESTYLARDAVIQKLPLRGDLRIELSPRGRLRYGTLARSISVAGLVVPAGSSVSFDGRGRIDYACFNPPIRIEGQVLECNVRIRYAPGAAPPRLSRDREIVLGARAAHRIQAL
jgi:hypothetical protein